MLRATNPYDSPSAMGNSSYSAFIEVEDHDDESHLEMVMEPDRIVPEINEFVHGQLRTLVLNDRFSCLGAQSAFRQDTYRFGLYSAMNSPEATAGLCRDLWFFVQEQPTMEADFSTFVASFLSPTLRDERHFEQLLWQQLQSLHNADKMYNEWDPTVSSDT